jgi:hypothetical protein
VVYTTPAPLPQSKWSPQDVQAAFGLHPRERAVGA